MTSSKSDGGGGKRAKKPRKASSTRAIQSSSREPSSISKRANPPLSDDDLDSWGPENRKDYEEACARSLLETGNLSPLTDDGRNGAEMETEPTDEDRILISSSAPVFPSSSSPTTFLQDRQSAMAQMATVLSDHNPPPILSPPPTTTLNTTNIRTTLLQVVNQATVRTWNNEYHAQRSVGIQNKPSTQIGQSAMASMASVLADPTSDHMWPAGERRRLLLPHESDAHDRLIRDIIDSNPQEFFRLLQARYPTNDNQTHYFTQALELIPPLDQLSQPENDNWVNSLSILFRNGQCTHDQQCQIIAAHAAISRRRTFHVAKRLHHLVYLSEQVYKTSSQPLADYMQRVVEAVSMKWQR